MNRREQVQAALDDHNPRPTGDPSYVPYWAKGEIARANGYSYTLEDGTQIKGGVITYVGQGTKAREEGSRGGELHKYPETPERPREAARKAEEPRSRAERPPKREPDLVGQLLQLHKTPEARRELCERYNIDWSIVESAPNPGVGSMRLANALRRCVK